MLSEQVGGDAWNVQQDALQQLAAHMHASVAAGSDEVVKDALVRHGKLDVLVHLLLVFKVTDAWTHPCSSADCFRLACTDGWQPSHKPEHEQKWA